MSFHIYPDPHTHPLRIAAHGRSQYFPFSEKTAIDAQRQANMMYLRVAMNSGSCHPLPDTVAAPDVFLKVGGGDDVAVPMEQTAALFDQGDDTGNEVADVIMTPEGNGVYLVRFFVLTAGSDWRLSLKNNDDVARTFTWVVGDAETETQQPWIEVLSSIRITVRRPGGETKQFDQIVNRGPGLLIVQDTGDDGTMETSVSLDPPEVPPNGCGKMTTSFWNGPIGE